jgi:hypothetical protein
MKWMRNAPGVNNLSHKGSVSEASRATSQYGDGTSYRLIHQQRSTSLARTDQPGHADKTHLLPNLVFLQSNLRSRKSVAKDREAPALTKVDTRGADGCSTACIKLRVT